MSPATLQVIDNGLDAAVARRLVLTRSLRARMRSLVGDEPDVAILGPAYWPIAVVHATARSTGRRRWVDRVQGAVDLVSGRIGLLDAALPEVATVTAAADQLVPARLSRQEALSSWHEYLRDWVDRRRKPLSPPDLTVDKIERLWLGHQHAVSQGREFLVDPVSHRAEELKNFPWAAQALRARHESTAEAS
jgi:hypothetical protein